MEKKEKKVTQKNTYSESISGDTESEYIIPKKKGKQRKKQQQNIKDIMMTKMMM